MRRRRAVFQLLKRKELSMTKTVAKQNIFGVPSPETANRIDNEDMVSAMHAATARMRELECQFEVKAAELRQAFIDETNKILNGVEA
jgi:hypothetical protein